MNKNFFLTFIQDFLKKNLKLLDYWEKSIPATVFYWVLVFYVIVVGFNKTSPKTYFFYTAFAVFCYILFIGTLLYLLATVKSSHKYFDEDFAKKYLVEENPLPVYVGVILIFFVVFIITRILFK